MKKLLIRGGRPLSGEVEISGMKNSALPILFATIITNDVCVIKNLPPVGDIEITLKILSAMGARVNRPDKTSVEIDTRDVVGGTSPDALVRCLRGSTYLLGAELARFGCAGIGITGGCNFGPRPIDRHIKGFCALGAQAEDNGRYTKIWRTGALVGTRVVMDDISVGATANIMIAATTAKGVTVIENAAQEPHIVDLACFLNLCGANITGAGTPKIKIRGVETLHGTTYTIVPDMIETGTYMMACAACGGNITLHNVVARHMEAVTSKLLEMGVAVETRGDTMTVRATKRLQSTSVQATPYPGFPTDMQPQITAALAVADGIGTVKDTVFHTRFCYTAELQKMGGAISVEDSQSTATVIGVHTLHGATVTATDLRAGAALLIAGLCADGETCILDAQMIERGYVDVVGKLTSLGADVRLVEDASSDDSGCEGGN